MSPQALKADAEKNEADDSKQGYVEGELSHSLPLEEKKTFSLKPPADLDDRYGEGTLGPRILFHESEVLRLAPVRLELRRVDGNDPLHPSGEHPPAEPRLAKADGPEEGSALPRRARLRAATDSEEEQKLEVRQPKDSKVVRHWKPIIARSPSPLFTPVLDPTDYLAELGIKSVYELSPSAHLLKLPRALHPHPSLLPPQNGSIPDAAQWQKLIAEAGHLFGLDPAFIAAMIRVESDFDPFAVSKAGAQGAMQIMPGTQKELGLGDPFDLRANIFAGSAYIHALLEHFGSVELALAAYNAGPATVDRFGGIPPYKETQNYVRKVMEHWQESYDASRRSPLLNGKGGKDGTVVQQKGKKGGKKSRKKKKKRI